MFGPAKIFSLAKPLSQVDEAKRNRTKYCEIPLSQNLTNYRVVCLGDLISHKDEIPKNIMDFVGVEGLVLVIANIVNKKVPYIILRSLRSKRFMVHGHSTLPYRVGSLTNFRYTDWLVVTESAIDADYLSKWLPNTVASCTAGLSSIGKEIVLTLTNRIVLAYDTDKAGTNAFYRDKKFFQSKGCQVRRLEFLEFKDPTEAYETSKFKDITHFESYLTGVSLTLT